MLRLIGHVCCLATMGFGQSAPVFPTFEVASIRAKDGPGGVIFGFSSSGTRVTLVGFPVKGLIMEAYNLKAYQVAFASSVPTPAEIYYDIIATAPGTGARTRDQFRPMLQALLAERFQLKVHSEMREMPVYAMVVGRNGPKFQESASDAAFNRNHGVKGRNQTVTATKHTMKDLVEEITGYFFVDRPVIDETGLAGAYDIQIEATPEFRYNREPEPGDINIFTAVQEQLGLKLEPRKARAEVLVVDRLEKPSAN